MSRSRLASISLVVGASSLALVLCGAVRAAEPPPEPPKAAPAPAPPPPPHAPPKAGEKAEEYYKNIQALKGIAAEDLVPTMQFISNSLGADCDFCHVERAPEKDDKKEKQTARKMIAMTLAINRDSFEGKHEVTCNSCHRGTEHPQGVPAIATAEHESAEQEENPKDAPAAESILAKYLVATGGPEAWGKVTARVLKGNLTGFGPAPFPVEIYAKAPGRRISIVHTPRGDNITAFDGHSGWLGNTGRPARDMSAAESEAARLDADLRFPADVKGLFRELKSAPAEKIDGHETVRVVGRNEKGPPVEMWFDAQSGLLVRLVRYAETALGRNPTQIDYADYREVEGVKIPFRWTVARPGGSFTIQVDEVQQNVPIEDTKFDRPAPS